MAIITDENYVLGFGRHKGKSIRELIEDGERDYLLWAHENVELFELDHILLDEVERDASATNWIDPEGYWDAERHYQ